MTNTPPPPAIIAARSETIFAKVNIAPRRIVPRREFRHETRTTGLKSRTADAGNQLVTKALTARRRRRRRGWSQVSGRNKCPGSDVWQTGMGREKGAPHGLSRFLTLCMGASLFIGGVTLARQSGTTSGPRREKTSNRAPLLKKNMKGSMSPGRSPAAAGDPGVEAKPGTEGGKAAQPGK